MIVLTSNIYFLKINFLNNQLDVRVPMVFSYWKLDVSQAAPYEISLIRLSVHLPVTKNFLRLNH